MAAAESARRPRPLRTILLGGLIAGALDITAAITQWALRGVQPTRILQGIASGLLGHAALEGGTATAALGLALHFFIATTWTAVFYVASRRLGFLTRAPWITGPLYGVFVWAFMAFVVLPLSAVTRRPFNPSMALIQVAIHIVCVGLPIAWTIRRSEGAHPG
jgi:hypothetical protein